MRVLFTCFPQAGHINPLLPLAEAFADQGDEVLLASGPDAEAFVTARGLPFRQAMPGFGDWYEALVRRTRGVPGDGLAPERVESYFIPRLFGEVGVAQSVDGLLAAAREFAPDVVVFDPVMFAGPLVAAVLGKPAVHHTIGPLFDPVVLDLVADAISPIWREFGLDVPAAAGLYEGTTVAICPPSLDRSAASVARVQLLRPSSRLDTPPPLPIRLPSPDLPLVYVTLGTFSNNPDVFRSLLESLADEPANIVVTVGNDNDPADLAPWPRNVVVERYIPQAELLPHCDAAVHHAGAGTTFGILAHGLPSVALPQSADNFRIAELLRAAGAARTVTPGNIDPATIRSCLRETMEEIHYRQAALKLAEEISSMPHAAEVAQVLQDLISETRGG